MGIKTAIENGAKAIWAIALSAIGLILVMWILNIIGLKEINYIFFFFGGIAIFMAGINPITLLASIFVGGISGKIDGDGFFKGIKKGVNDLFHFVNGIAYAFVLLSGVAAIISFKESPSSFFAIFVAITILYTGASYMKKSVGGFTAIMTYSFVFYICIRAFWAIIPVDTKVNIGMNPRHISKIENVIGTGKEKIKAQINTHLQVENSRELKAAEKAKEENDKLEKARMERIEKERREAEKINADKAAAQKRKEIEDRLNNNFQ
jgi:hypothetical protein